MATLPAVSCEGLAEIIATAGRVAIKKTLAAPRTLQIPFPISVAAGKDAVAIADGNALGCSQMWLFGSLTGRDGIEMILEGEIEVELYADQPIAGERTRTTGKLKRASYFMSSAGLREHVRKNIEVVGNSGSDEIIFRGESLEQVIKECAGGARLDLIPGVTPGIAKLYRPVYQLAAVWNLPANPTIFLKKLNAGLSGIELHEPYIIHGRGQVLLNNAYVKDIEQTERKINASNFRITGQFAIHASPSFPLLSVFYELFQPPFTAEAHLARLNGSFYYRQHPPSPAESVERVGYESVMLSPATVFFSGDEQGFSALGAAAAAAMPPAKRDTFMPVNSFGTLYIDRKIRQFEAKHRRQEAGI